MSKRSGGISFGTIIWSIVIYNIFFSSNDDKDKKNVEVKVDDSPGIVEQVKETGSDAFEDIKPGLKEIANTAKIEFEKSKEKIMAEFEKKKQEVKEERKKKEESKPEKDMVVESGDKFSNSDNLYGDTDSKW